MDFTLRMKRLLWIVPWMGILAAAGATQEISRAAEAVLTPLENTRREALRIGDACYVPAETLEGWGWTVRTRRFDVEVEAFGRSARVSIRTQSGKTLVALDDVVRQLGSGGAWRENVFEVWSVARKVHADADGVLFESTLGARPALSFLENPRRAVLDFHGVRLSPTTEIALGPKARASQFKPDVVRVVVETLARPSLQGSTPAPSNRFSIRFGEVKPSPPAPLPRKGEGGAGGASHGPSPSEPLPRKGEGGAGGASHGPLPPDPLPRKGEGSQAQKGEWGSPASSSQGQGVSGAELEDSILSLPPAHPISERPYWEPFNLEPPGGGRWVPFVGPLRVTGEGPKSATLEVSLTAKLPSAPMFSRPEPKVLEILLPGARIGDPRPIEFKTPSVGELERIQEPRGVTLRLHLVRPMGVELSHAGSTVHIVLVKPQVGDGRLAGKVVVVDAGHGGDDSGARSPDKSVNEKDLTLSIAKLITTNLAHEGATVIMTRKTDVRIPLKERSEIANRNGAHFFVSVHINSNTVANRTSGGITFFHKQDPLGRLLADCIQGEIAKVSGIPNMGTWSDQRIYDSGFAVLRYAQMPAVLLELGFINHSFDRKRMRTEEFQQAVAKAVVRGLKVYLGNE